LFSSAELGGDEEEVEEGEGEDEEGEGDEDEDEDEDDESWDTRSDCFSKRRLLVISAACLATCAFFVDEATLICACSLFAPPSSVTAAPKDPVALAADLSRSATSSRMASAPVLDWSACP
jgi:hypothetical protein